MFNFLFLLIFRRRYLQRQINRRVIELRKLDELDDNAGEVTILYSRVLAIIHHSDKNKVNLSAITKRFIEYTALVKVLVEEVGETSHQENH